MPPSAVRIALNWWRKYQGLLPADWRLINPLISAIVSKPDFSFLVLHVHGGVIKYGDFLNATISFLIIAATVYFMVVLPVNTLMAKFKPKVVEAPATKPCPECLSEIPIAAKRCSHCAQLVA